MTLRDKERNGGGSSSALDIRNLTASDGIALSSQGVTGKEMLRQWHAPNHHWN
jgi:hypothetical protein